MNLIYLLFACGEANNPTTKEEEIKEEEIIYETGCFVLNGDTGYAWLNDAISVANDGDEITMDNCSESHEEKVIVDKSVSIIGNGSSISVFVAPINDVAFEITADNVFLSGIQIETTRSAINILNSDGTSIDDIIVVSGGGWGLKSENATNLNLNNLQISQMDFGGISLKDSTGTIDNAVLTDNMSNAILIDGGDVRIDHASITNTAPANATTPEDGNAIKLDGGAVVTVANTNCDNNMYTSTYVTSGDLTVEDSTLQNSLLAAVFTDPNNSNITLF